MSDEPEEVLRIELAKLFLDASQAAVQRLSDLNWPLLVDVMEQHIKRDKKSPGNWRGEQTRRQQNTLGAENVALHNLAPLLSPGVVVSLSQCAARIAGAPWAKLPFFSPFGFSHSWMLTHSTSQYPRAVPYSDDPSI